jgi:hypothetical protein
MDGMDEEMSVQEGAEMMKKSDQFCPDLLS